MASERVWLSSSVLEFVLRESDEQLPMETGGILLGYWCDFPREAVIIEAVGPGPKGIHERDRFVPDHDFQTGELARLYQESGRKLCYLGDWHSHPGGGGSLSSKDQVTLRMIASAPDARAPVADAYPRRRRRLGSSSVERALGDNGSLVPAVQGMLSSITAIS